MNGQRAPFPPMRALFPPMRAPFPRGARRGQRGPRGVRPPGWRPPAPSRVPERAVLSSVNSNPPVTPYNCSELLEALKLIQQVARCSLCDEDLRSARTCAAGHGLCHDCATQCDRVCPLCGSVVTDTEPVMLNNMIKLLPRPCKYNTRGCECLILAADTDHETFCRFRNVTCRIPSCGRTCSAKDLLRHLEDCHGQGMIRTAKHSAILKDFNAKTSRDGLAVIVAFNNIIWQHSRVGNNSLLQFYQYVPMEKPRVKFSVEVSFHSPEKSFSGWTPVHTDEFDPHQLFKDEETFCLPHKLAESFSRFYTGVKYDFEIIKEDL